MTLTDLSTEPYVLLTTFRASGTPVGTPVWVVEGLGGLLVTTSGASGKVKRIRHNDAVAITPCDARVTIMDGASTVEGHAVVLEDSESRAVIDAALERKYGLRYKTIKAAGKLRRSTTESVVVKVVSTF